MLPAKLKSRLNPVNSWLQSQDVNTLTKMRYSSIMLLINELSEAGGMV
jgi:hypothetical protein